MAKRTIVAIIALIVVIAGIVWFITQDKKTTATPVLSVSAFNQTQNVSATDREVSANDTVVYTLTAENQSDEVIGGYIVEANISEITDKATLIDASGASYNSATSSLVWTPLDIAPHDKITQQFSVRVNPLPAGTASASLRIKFNNELAVAISPTQSVAVNPVVSGTNNQNNNYKAPTTGVSEWLPAILALLATIIFIANRKYRLIKIPACRDGMSGR